MPISAVRNRIASFEAQTSQASPSDSSMVGTPNRRRTSIAAKKKRDALRQQHQHQQNEERLQVQHTQFIEKETPGRTPTNTNSSDDDTTRLSKPSTSTTVTASENRKSRIRQSQQQTRENVPNLLEKRRVMRDRRIQQKERRNSNSEEADTDEWPANASTPTDNHNTDTNLSNNDHRVPDSPGNRSNSSSTGGTRWSKMQRMRRKGYENVSSKKMGDQNNNNDDNIVPRQSSVGTNVTASNNSAVTSLVRNTSTNNIAAVRLRGENYIKTKTATSRTIDKMMSATVALSSKTRRQRQETLKLQSNSDSFNNHHHSHTSANSSSSSNKNSPSHHSSRSRGTSLDIMSERQQHHGDNSVVRGNSQQQQLDASLEAGTDDEATLTSVHRIMEESNSNNQNNNNHTNQSAYETLESHYHDTSSGRSNYNSTSLQASYDSSVGPSWKPSSSRNSKGGSRPIVAGDIFKANNNGTSNGMSKNGRNIWIDEEKSEKTRIQIASSSDYDTDGDISKTSRQSTHFVEGPIHSQATDVNDFFTSSRFSQQPSNNNINNSNNTNNNMNNNNSNSNSNSNNNNTNSNRRIDDDERTFDYGDRDDDSNGGTSYAARRRKEAERRARLAASSNDNHNLEQSIHQQDGNTNGNNGEPLLLNKDDMEHLTIKDSPSLRLSAGVAGVATMGCIAFGPVGLLIGVAAGGLGFGFMQIPEEERKKIQAKAEKAVNNFQEKACDASEVVSSSCLTTYQDSGVADHVPHCLSSNVADHLPNCPTGGTTKSENFCNTGRTTDSVQLNTHTDNNHPTHPSTSPSGPLMEQTKTTSLSHNDRLRKKKVACLRNVRILPIAQIHGLDSSSQPRAWLDIVASANTSSEQKNEAMEEILLLAKDKRRAKIFLDEGILDYIIWTLSRYFEKLEVVEKKIDWAFPDITTNEKTASNLAALCCVTLGKAHCAAIHTEGDLLLMSMYERGTVPEERQVAQMLHEVPHHARVTKTNDPTTVQPSKEVFAPRQLTLSQAEELANSIKAVADGQL